MKRKKEEIKEKSPIIEETCITTDGLSSRGGLSLLLRYLRSIKSLPIFETAVWIDRKEQERPGSIGDIQAAFLQFCRWNKQKPCAF